MRGHTLYPLVLHNGQHRLQNKKTQFSNEKKTKEFSRLAFYSYQKKREKSFVSILRSVCWSHKQLKHDD